MKPACPPTQPILRGTGSNHQNTCLFIGQPGSPTMPRLPTRLLLGSSAAAPIVPIAECRGRPAPAELAAFGIIRGCRSSSAATPTSRRRGARSWGRRVTVADLFSCFDGRRSPWAQTGLRSTSAAATKCRKHPFFLSLTVVFAGFAGSRRSLTRLTRVQRLLRFGCGET